MRNGIVRTVAAAAALIAIACFLPAQAESEHWRASAIGGGELHFAPGLDQLTGHGWVGFDSLGKGLVGNGDLHLFYNTTKLHAGIERLAFADGKLAFFGFLEGEALISQLLVDYFQRGERIKERGFNASYLLLHGKLQWYPGKQQTLELSLQGRRWWFNSRLSWSCYSELR